MARRDQEHTPLPFPNGWFAVAFAHELREGQVMPLRYLGAHLGHGGRVAGESIRCPFHGWHFDGATGACTRIPYCERIPTQARVRPWEVQEKNRMIIVWR